jgi:hypothetical protein
MDFPRFYVLVQKNFAFPLLLSFIVLAGDDMPGPKADSFDTAGLEEEDAGGDELGALEDMKSGVNSVFAFSIRDG